MSDQIVPAPAAPVRTSAAIAALDEEAPSIAELFAFMEDAELRVGTLRMRVAERIAGARGEELSTVELILRHPGRARVTTRRGEDPLSRDYRVWASDGEIVTTYDALAERASVRPVRPAPVGADDPRKPSFARVHPVRTALPANSIVDAFVHPAGFVRNVLSTGPVTLVGTMRVASGREALVLRAEHPRSSHVLTDRPDRSIEIGVDRLTGFISLLVERIGDRVTHHAETTALETDVTVPDEAFLVHLPSDVRMIY